MLQARAPPSGFPSPGDGKWSYNRLNVIVELLTNIYHDCHLVSLCLVRIGIFSHFSDSGAHSELWDNELFRCRGDGYLQVETLNIFFQLDLVSLITYQIRGHIRTKPRLGYWQWLEFCNTSVCFATAVPGQKGTSAWAGEAQCMNQ